MRLRSAAILILIISSWANGQTYKITTFAGGGLPGNIPGTSASLVDVNGVAIDRVGNVFISLAGC